MVSKEVSRTIKSNFMKKNHFLNSFKRIFTINLITKNRNNSLQSILKKNLKIKMTSFQDVFYHHFNRKLD